MSFAIVGLGITGLSLAYYLAKNTTAEVHIYEQSSSPGGILNDYKYGSQFFFNSCQYLSENSLLLDFIDSDICDLFLHRTGSISQHSNDIELSSSLANPSISGQLNITSFPTLNKCASLLDRINLYPPSIQYFLLDWCKSISVDPSLFHHSSADSFQIGRLFCTDEIQAISALKARFPSNDFLYALPRTIRGLSEPYFLLPKYGYNDFFEKMISKLPSNVTVHLGTRISPDSNNSFLSESDYTIWTGNPNPLVKLFSETKLNSFSFVCDIISGYTEFPLCEPIYIQIFSSKSPIMRIFLYNINNVGCYTIETINNLLDSSLIVADSNRYISSFTSSVLSDPLIRKKQVRYSALSLHDYSLLSRLDSSFLDSRIIVPDYSIYGRDQKISSILQRIHMFS